MQPIEAHLLRQVTGGGARDAAHARGDSGTMLMMIASLQSAIQAAANKRNQMLNILPAMTAMKKGDKEGAIKALMGASGGDHKPA
jgi:hypothetical protein